MTPFHRFGTLGRWCRRRWSRYTLIGFDGNDVLFGGADSDRLSGGSGIDYLDAGAGDDSDVDGDDGDDIVRGGTGDDVLHGGLGIDQVYGDEETIGCLAMLAAWFKQLSAIGSKAFWRGRSRHAVCLCPPGGEFVFVQRPNFSRGRSAFWGRR